MIVWKRRAAALMGGRARYTGGEQASPITVEEVAALLLRHQANLLNTQDGEEATLVAETDHITGFPSDLQVVRLARDMFKSLAPSTDEFAGRPCWWCPHISRSRNEQRHLRPLTSPDWTLLRS